MKYCKSVKKRQNKYGIIFFLHDVTVLYSSVKLIFCLGFDVVNFFTAGLMARFLCKLCQDIMGENENHLGNWKKWKKSLSK